jgi:hypothetical protein
MRNIARDALFQGLRGQGLDKASVADDPCQSRPSTPLDSKAYRRRVPLPPHQSLVDDTLAEPSGAAVIANAGTKACLHLAGRQQVPALGTCVTKW